MKSSRTKSMPMWIWQLPQHLLALALILLTRATVYRTIGGAYVHHADRKFGISLGEYIIIDKRFCGEKTVRHEYGHTKQSRMLGPLYLILVGIPSVVFHWLTRFGVLEVSKYYQRYPENWADRLGGVDR